MKNNLLEEIQLLFEKKKDLKRVIPVPSYLFVQRYGRQIHEHMKEIAEVFGQKDWFIFSCASVTCEEKLLSAFKMELERHSGIGKEYTGSILVEFSGEKEEKQIEDLLEYIHKQKQRIHCIYTIKVSEEENIKELLEKYGFVRVVRGEEYETFEQIEIFQEVIKLCQLQLEEDAEKYIVDFFEKLKWQEEDVVKIRIQNMAKEIVYNKLMENGDKEKNIKKEDVESVLHSLKVNKGMKRQIGFVRGGVEA